VACAVHMKALMDYFSYPARTNQQKCKSAQLEYRCVLVCALCYNYYSINVPAALSASRLVWCFRYFRSDFQQ
jgi:hypothetical protein